MNITEKVKVTQHNADRIARLLNAIKARGYTPHEAAITLNDVRDAAHEACHALKWDVTKPWTRANIHAKSPERTGVRIVHEVTARAVEQLVCADLGAPCDSIAKCAHNCFMELLFNERIRLPSGTWLEDRIREYMERAETLEMAARVLALGEAL